MSGTDHSDQEALRRAVVSSGRDGFLEEAGPEQGLEQWLGFRQAVLEGGNEGSDAQCGWGMCIYMR